MNYSVLEKSSLFSGVPAKELRVVLEAVPHHIQRYDKGETVFHLMEDADRIGIILELFWRDECRHRSHSRMEAKSMFQSVSPVN